MSRKSNSALSRQERKRNNILVACLVVSGACGLIYETVWLREFSLVMGHTVHALSAMLTAFLGGLALGAFVAGRFTEKRGTGLSLYAALEVGIAVFALAMAPMISFLSPVFGAAYRGLQGSFLAYNLVQLLLCGTLLLLPTVLMGATLPVIAALLLKDKDGSQSVGRLYGANSLGGALGAMLAGFLLLPALGMTGTVLVAAGMNLTVAAVALILWRAEGRPALTPCLPAVVSKGGRSTSAWPLPSPRLLAAIYALSGLAALMLEVGWSRIVSLSLGSTTYGFTIILTTFVLGIALGSEILPRFRFFHSDGLRGVVFLHGVIAAWSLLTLSELGRLPLRIVHLVGDEDLSFAGLLANEMLLVGFTIAVPTLAMGAIFPLITSLMRAQSTSAGRALGTAYASNTLGNILGSFLAGFVLIPTLGMRTTIVLAACLSTLAGLLYLLPALRTGVAKSRVWALVLSSVTVLAAVFAPAWDQAIVTSGPFLYGRSLSRRAHSIGGPDAVEKAVRERFVELLDYREGATTVVTVKRARNGGLHLQVGGKSDAFSSASTQNLIAHLPMLLHGSAKEVLIVGLGSGSTLGSTLLHPVEHVECVEISAEVRDVAREYFSEFTGNALDDPRAEVFIGDGRNHVRHSNGLFDVIISQPSNPWVSGAAGLFTLDYFREVREHLRPGGVACSWFKLVADDGRATRSVLAAWQEVFPSCFLFETRAQGEFVIIGMEDGGPIDAGAMARALRPEVSSELRRLGVNRLADLLGGLVLDGDGIAAHSKGAVFNTDDNARVELIGPKLLSQTAKILLTSELAELRQVLSPQIDLSGLSLSESQGLRASLLKLGEGKALVAAAKEEERTNGRSEAWRGLVERARVLVPAESYLRTVR